MSVNMKNFTDTESTVNNTKKKFLVDNIKIIIKDCVVTAIVTIFLFTKVFTFGVVSGASMYPTLKDGQSYIGYSLFSTPRRGDIIVAKHIDGINIIKRAIAIGGDTVRIDDKGVVFVNGIPVDEEYIVNKSNFSGVASSSITIPAGHIFVLGDNRANSTDSRYESIGFVSEEDILCKAILFM